jgi:hypothetical protein
LGAITSRTMASIRDIAVANRDHAGPPRRAGISEIRPYDVAALALPLP